MSGIPLPGGWGGASRNVSRSLMITPRVFYRRGKIVGEKNDTSYYISFRSRANLRRRRPCVRSMHNYVGYPRALRYEGRFFQFFFSVLPPPPPYGIYCGRQSFLVSLKTRRTVHGKTTTLMRFDVTWEKKITDFGFVRNAFTDFLFNVKILWRVTRRTRCF